MPELIDHVIKLREMLSDIGDYSIRRTDGNHLEFWEIMTLGKLFYDIDEEIKKCQS